MEKIIWEDKEASLEVYIKVREDLKKAPSYFGTPYCEYVLGFRQIVPSFISQKLIYVAEDGFAMIGDELLKKLKSQIEKYVETQIVLYDHAQDTDSEIVFDCQKDKVILSGTLGNTTSAEFFGEFIKTSFKFEVGKEFLANLYNALNDASIK